MHGFRNSIEGPILQIPRSSIRLDAQLDTLWFGVNVKFGGPKHKAPAMAPCPGPVDSPPPTWSAPSVPPPPPSPSDPASGLTENPGTPGIKSIEK
jgi:hypothetical protein